MNQVYYCPVCGFVISDESADCLDASLKKKCPECKGKMMATGKEYNSFWQRSPNKDDWCDALENLEETVREEYVYDNPQFNQKKYEKREQKDQERIARNRAGLSPLDNHPKCPTCGSENLSRISGIGTISIFGNFGTTNGEAGKTFKCNNCGYRW